MKTDTLPWSESYTCMAVILWACLATGCIGFLVTQHHLFVRPQITRQQEQLDAHEVIIRDLLEERYKR